MIRKTMELETNHVPGMDDRLSTLLRVAPVVWNCWNPIYWTRKSA